jgi:hypothetical protein
MAKKTYCVGTKLNLWLLVWLVSGLSLMIFPQTSQAAATTKSPASVLTMPGIAPPDFFGVVGRDPWYEWNTNPNYGGSNREYLENMARELKAMGARYVRIEFRADRRDGVRGGVVDFAKYDPFVMEIAPRYGIKVLGLLGYAMVNWDAPGDKDLHYANYNAPADQANGSNPLIRMFALRSRDVIAHYGDKVAAWEVLNEVNYWEGVTLQPDRLGALMVYTYGLGKSAVPGTQILVGAQLAPQPPEAIDSYQYLESFFHSTTVQDYVKRPRPDGYQSNPFPWDGLAWHPYYSDPAEVVRSVQRVVQTMRNWGDLRNKVWVTEVGRMAAPQSNQTCGQSADEAAQANYLTEVYTRLVNSNVNDIAAVFWFKYEDFYDNQAQKVINYGLVRLDGPEGQGPSGKVARYKAAYYAYQRVAGPELPVDRVPAPAVQRSAANPKAPVYFTETGHTLNDAFLNYWQRNGGLELFGFPITEPFEELNLADGRRYTVQYFERERFEYHPEKAGTPYEVLLGLLGNDLLKLDCRSYPSLPAPPPSATDQSAAFRTYFRETGHYLSFRFKRYWEQRGGLSVYGYPISEEMVETSAVDGKQYAVQYFERARFEYHPAAPADYQVQLALLGTEMLKHRGWVK